MLPALLSTSCRGCGYEKLGRLSTTGQGPVGNSVSIRITTCISRDDYGEVAAGPVSNIYHGGLVSRTCRSQVLSRPAQEEPSLEGHRRRSQHTQRRHGDLGGYISTKLPRYPLASIDNQVLHPGNLKFLHTTCTSDTKKALHIEISSTCYLAYLTSIAAVFGLVDILHAS